MLQALDIAQRSPRSPAIGRYGIAVIAVLVATAVRLTLDSVMPHGLPYLLFPLAVVVSSRLAGASSGLAATFLSLPLAAYLFFEPRYSSAIPNPHDLAGMVVFAVVGICLSFLAGRGREARVSWASPGRSFPRRLVLLGGACILLFGLSHILYSDFERNRDQQQWVAHTYQTVNAGKALMSTLQDAETAQRGYLLTAESGYLEQYRAAIQAEPAVRQALRRLTGGNPAQQARMDALDSLIAAKLGSLAKGIETRQEGDMDEVAALVRHGEGRRYMDQIRTVLRTAEAEEEGLLRQRAAAADAQGASMRWVLGLGAGSLLLLLVFAAVVIERDFREREEARQVLHDQRQALLQSEEATRALLEASSQAIVGVAPDGVIAMVNNNTEQIFGYAREELIGQSLELLIPDRLRQRHQEHLQNYREDGKPRPIGLGIDLTARRKDGSEFPVEVGLARVRTASGPLLVSYITDITERQRAGQALRKSEEDLRRYMESAPASIATFDRDMRYVAVSRRFRDDYRLGERDLLGHSHYEIFPEIPENWRAVHRRCLEGAVERCAGERFQRADGSEQWIRWEIQPWRQTDGTIGGIVLLIEEITRQRRAEEEIRSLNASLEERVRDRTEQLATANRELEAFSYSVSHDLRAPLRGIDGWSLALLEDCGAQLDPQARQYLGRVRDETQRLSLLIDGMLRLSRISWAEMRHDAVDLTSLVDAIAARLREASPGRQLEFHVQAGLTALGDSHLLEIALTNLMENAVKFTGPRPVGRIEFGSQVGDGETVFYVRDNGVGFDLAYAGMLFGVFQRLHKPAEFPGTGIGLATVQRVIHRHGGRVWAEAQPDNGATFYFTIGGVA